VVCPSCGERNPDGAPFCLNRGVALVAAARREEERKVVTVLFCDLEQAAERYEECSAGRSRCGSAFERAQARLGLARALEGLERPGAGEAFEEARALFRKLGAAPWLREIDAIGDARAAVT